MEAKNVFKFLDSYSKEDAGIFFGREGETQEIYQRCSFSKILVVYGRSGTGKTSIIRCGLGNAFDDQDWLPVFVRRSSEINRDTLRAIREVAVSESNREAGLVKEIRNLYLDHFKPVYLIFDQFEELFIFGETEEIESFFRSVKALIESDQDVHLLFVIREEYLAYLTEAEEVIPEFLENRIRIEHLSPKRLREVVEKMCAAAGIELEEGFSEELTERMTSGKAALELSYLQVYLDAIRKKYPDTDRFTKEMIEALGTFGDVLGNFLQRQLDHQPDPAKGETVLKAFVSVQGTKRLINTEELENLTAEFGVLMEREELEGYVNRFVTGRILRQVGEEGKHELRHDTLAKVIYERITLAEKELLEAKQFVHNAYNRFQKNGTRLRDEDLDYLAPYAKRLYLKDEQKAFIDEAYQRKERKQKRKLRLTQIGVAVLLLLLIGAGYLLYENYKERRLQARIDESHRLAELSKSDEIGDPMLAFLLAEKAHEIYEGPHTHSALLEAYDRGPGIVERLKSNAVYTLENGTLIIIDLERNKWIHINTNGVRNEHDFKIDQELFKIDQELFDDGVNFALHSGGYIFNKENKLLSYSWNGELLDSIFTKSNTSMEAKFSEFQEINHEYLSGVFTFDNSLVFITINGRFKRSVDDSEYPVEKFLFIKKNRVYWRSKNSVFYRDISTELPSRKNISLLFEEPGLIGLSHSKDGKVLVSTDDGFSIYGADGAEKRISKEEFSKFCLSTGLEFNQLIQNPFLLLDTGEYVVISCRIGDLDAMDYAALLLTDEYERDALGPLFVNIYLKCHDLGNQIFAHGHGYFVGLFNDCFFEYDDRQQKFEIIPHSKYVQKGSVLSFYPDSCKANHSISDYVIGRDKLQLLENDFIFIGSERPKRFRIFREEISSGLIKLDSARTQSWKIPLPIHDGELEEFRISSQGYELTGLYREKEGLLHVLIINNSNGSVLLNKKISSFEKPLAALSDSTRFTFLNRKTAQISYGNEIFIIHLSDNHKEKRPDGLKSPLGSNPLVSKSRKGFDYFEMKNSDPNKYLHIPSFPITSNHEIVYASDSIRYIYYKRIGQSSMHSRLSYLAVTGDTVSVHKLNHYNYFEKLHQTEYSLMALSRVHEDSSSCIIDLFNSNLQVETVEFQYWGKDIPQFKQVGNNLYACSEDTIMILSLFDLTLEKLSFPGITILHEVWGNDQKRLFISYKGEDESYFVYYNQEEGVTDTLKGSFLEFSGSNETFIIPTISNRQIKFTGSSARTEIGTQQRDVIYQFNENGNVTKYKNLRYIGTNSTFIKIRDISPKEMLFLDDRDSEIILGHIGNEHLYEYITIPKYKNNHSRVCYDFIADKYILTSHRLLNQYELFPINGEVAIEMVREQGRLGEVRDFTEEEIEKYQLK